MNVLLAALLFGGVVSGGICLVAFIADIATRPKDDDEELEQIREINRHLPFADPIMPAEEEE